MGAPENLRDTIRHPYQRFIRGYVRVAGIGRYISTTIKWPVMPRTALGGEALR